MKKQKVHPIIAGLGGISAQVIEYSLPPNEHAKPLLTMQLRYPRFIHSEFMTHRVFSRNASSSRAIPVARILDQVVNDPAMPIHWGKNQAGMQADEQSDAMVKLAMGEVTAEEAWRHAGHAAAVIAKAMSDAGYHKQVVNRILEPFQFISVIVTATEWENFFELRDHPDAQPEIRELAAVMKKAIEQAVPRPLIYGEWHLPYVNDMERGIYNNDSLCKLSAARCARVSYLKHDGSTPTPADDFDLFDRLVGSKPLHASPIEHQATPDHFDMPHNPGQWSNRNYWGNFVGWVQNRKVFEEASL